MKKFLLTLSSLFIGFLPSIAQPVFTSNECFQVNDNSKLGFAVLSEKFETYLSSTGSNFTWDFASKVSSSPWFNWSAPTIDYKFQPGANGSSFDLRTSEINEESFIAFARNNYFTYALDKDTLYLDGIGTTRYIPRIPYLSFPLKYKDSVYTKTALFINKLNIGNVSRYWIYDGFGTIKFPYGIAEEVYRIRTHQIDSNFIIKQGTVYEELIWFRKSDGIPVLRFLKTGNLISAYYAGVNGANATEKLYLDQTTMVYPNPFQSTLYLDHIQEPIQFITITNCLGETIKIQQITSKELSLEHLSSGVYQLEIKTIDGKIIRNKICKY
ncbi:MAG: T9SS C-terminal target domain-containing protein [Cytophagales bacterium]|nr:MAG: T9SS C-terminal target domain-containing protein [Cytophagales bacterium]